MSFSRKKNPKATTHPQLQSAPVLNIPTFKDIKSAEDLYQWLKKRSELHYKLGQMTYFPRFNIRHFTQEDGAIVEMSCDEELDLFTDNEEDSMNDQELLTNEEELLTKRKTEYSSEKKKMLEEIAHLKEENKKLLGS